MTTAEKIFIDTSVLVRFLTGDDKRKYQECKSLFEVIKVGRVRPYISNMVIAELVFVLTRQYKFDRLKVVKMVKQLLQLRNLTLAEKTTTLAAVDVYSKYKIKYGDCLIATQVPKGVRLITYDADFSKIKGLTVATPEMIIPTPLATATNRA